MIVAGTLLSYWYCSALGTNAPLPQQRRQEFVVRNELHFSTHQLPHQLILLLGD